LTTIPVILNPTAGGGRLLRLRPELDAAALRLDVELEFWFTTHRGHGEQLAREAASQNRPLVLAWGGDGTYNEVARGLVGSTSALGVLPGGTTSVLAYEFEIPRPAPRALEALLEGTDRAMRVGTSDHDDLVMLMLSCGPDSVIVRDAIDRRTGNYRGKTGIALQAARELVSGRPLPRLRVRSGDRTVEGGWAIVGNSRSFAGPYRATPGADPFVPAFEVVVHQGRSRAAVMGFALGIPLGRHVARRDVIRFACNRVTIEPLPDDARLPYQVDGDPVRELPVTLEVDPRSLIVRLPHRPLR
jgi:diacylglycerol kinase family enzyme